MKLQRVFGNTYFIKGGTNTGVYLFENKNALLIDPGLSGLRPKNMINMFENEKIIVQGAVDLCFEEDGEIVVLDFKTDHAEDGEALRAAYGGQLAIYALACEKIFEKPVKQTVIYSFALSKEINV